MPEETLASVCRRLGAAPDRIAAAIAFASDPEMRRHYEEPDVPLRHLLRLTLELAESLHRHGCLEDRRLGEWRTCLSSLEESIDNTEDLGHMASVFDAAESKDREDAAVPGSVFTSAEVRDAVSKGGNHTVCLEDLRQVFGDFIRVLPDDVGAAYLQRLAAEEITLASESETKPRAESKSGGSISSPDDDSQATAPSHLRLSDALGDLGEAWVGDKSVETGDLPPAMWPVRLQIASTVRRAEARREFEEFEPLKQLRSLLRRDTQDLPAELKKESARGAGFGRLVLRCRMPIPEDFEHAWPGGRSHFEEVTGLQSERLIKAYRDQEPPGFAGNASSTPWFHALLPFDQFFLSRGWPQYLAERIGETLSPRYGSTGASREIEASPAAAAVTRPKRTCLEVQRCLESKMLRQESCNTYAALAKEIGCSPATLTKVFAMSPKLMKWRDSHKPPKKARFQQTTEAIYDETADPKQRDPSEIASQREIESQHLDKISDKERADYHAASEAVKSELLSLFESQLRDEESSSGDKSPGKRNPKTYLN